MVSILFIESTLFWDFSDPPLRNHCDWSFCRDSLRRLNIGIIQDAIQTNLSPFVSRSSYYIHVLKIIIILQHMLIFLSIFTKNYNLKMYRNPPKVWRLGHDPQFGNLCSGRYWKLCLINTSELLGNICVMYQDLLTVWHNVGFYNIT